MATLTRWWTPAGTVPVEHLLRIGPDPQKDLGLALFAVHKAGAEACELVAQTAVADEMVLAAALAETRAQIAPPAVQVISKGVGTPQYAGLLLADLLDDAESAALSLYRSCLAKSVAPPIAAQRVGMVFGVPSRELGAFSKLATDPKASPVAVQDAADRALFDYVARVVTEEYVPAKEEVSKAPTRDYHGREPGERDAEGQFARLRTQTEGGGKDVLPGVSLQDLFNQAAAPKEVATPAQDTPGPSEVATRATRKTRKLRETRKTRPTAAEPAASLDAPRLARAGLKPSLSRMTLTAKQLQVQELLQQMAPPPVPLALNERPVPDMLISRGHRDGLYELDNDVSFVLTDAEFSAMTRKAKTSPGQEQTVLLRLGALEEYAGKPRVHQVDGVEHPHHTDGVQHVYDREVARPGYAGQHELYTEDLHDSMLDNTSVGSLTKSILDAQDEFLRRAAKAAGIVGLNPVNERGNVSMQMRKDRPDVWKLSWRPFKTDERGRRQLERPRTPGLVEIVVPAGQVFGRVNRDGSVEVDPNALMRVKTLGAPPVGQNPRLKRVTAWDEDLKALRTIVTMEEVDEGELFKSDSDYHGREPGERDQLGQFARVRDAVPRVDLQALFNRATVEHAEPVQAPGRRTRATRSTRKLARVRASTPSGQPALGKPAFEQTKLTSKLKAASLKAASLKAAELARQRLKEDHTREGGLPWLDDEVKYAVIPAGVMWSMASEDGLDHTFIDGMDQTWVLGKGAQEYLLAWGKKVPGGDAEDALTTNVLDAWNEQTEEPQDDEYDPDEYVIRRQKINDPVDLDSLARHLVARMATDHELSVLSVDFRHRGANRWEVIVHGNQEELPIQHLLTYSEDSVPGQPKKLYPGLTRRMHNHKTISNWLHVNYLSLLESKLPGASISLVNPHIKTWTIE